MTSPTLDQKLFFTRLPFWPKVAHLVDVGSGPLAEVSAAAQAQRPLAVTCVDSEVGLSWETFLSSRAGLWMYDPVALLFSSVLHEMFSEAGHYKGFEPKSFWADVATVNPEYVIVRDMAWSVAQDWEPEGTQSMNDRLQNTAMLALLAGHREQAKLITKRMMEATGPDTVNYGAVVREYVEMLLKARYDPGEFEREGMEFYFALEPQAFLAEAVLDGYDVVHSRAFTPPFLGAYLRPRLPPSLRRKDAFTTHVEYVFKRRQE